MFKKLGSCAHGAAYHFYAYTITNQEAYKAYRCNTFEEAKNQTCAGEDTAIMGYGASSR